MREVLLGAGAGLPHEGVRDQVGVDDERDEIPTTGVEAVGRGEYLMQPREMDEAIATELTGRLDGLFACAGGSTGVGPLATSDVETIRSTMELNYIGTFLCIKHGGTQMARQEHGGSIIGCSSHAGSDPFRCLGAYGAAKAGLDHLCRIAADEMGEFGVRVNSIQPGIVGTELMTPITGGGKLLDDYMPLIPLGRIGDPSDIAEMVRFLVGPESAWLTGQNIAVDGGQNLRRGADYGEMLREFGVDPMAPILGDTEG